MNVHALNRYYATSFHFLQKGQFLSSLNKLYYPAIAHLKNNNQYKLPLNLVLVFVFVLFVFLAPPDEGKSMATTGNKELL